MYTYNVVFGTFVVVGCYDVIRMCYCNKVFTIGFMGGGLAIQLCILCLYMYMQCPGIIVVL